jgi:hypothetical protein
VPLPLPELFVVSHVGALLVAVQAQVEGVALTWIDPGPPPTPGDAEVDDSEYEQVVAAVIENVPVANAVLKLLL